MRERRMWCESRGDREKRRTGSRERGSWVYTEGGVEPEELGEEGIARGALRER